MRCGCSRALKTVALVALACHALVACQTNDPGWTEDDVRSVYGAVIGGLRDRAGGSLMIDPRSRFLIPDGTGSLQIGDFNRYGDESLAAAIEEDPLAVACRLDSEGDCAAIVQDHFFLVSEPLPLGHREAVVLAAQVEFHRGPVSSRSLVLHLRYGSGQWRVVRIWDGGSVRTPSGFSGAGG